MVPAGTSEVVATSASGLSLNLITGLDGDIGAAFGGDIGTTFGGDTDAGFGEIDDITILEYEGGVVGSTG